MHYKKIVLDIKEIEQEYKLLSEELKKHKLIKSDANHYLTEDKISFKLLWKKYIIFFLKTRKLMRASKYRRGFFSVNYNKLVILRYLSFFYFNVLVDLINTFDKHEEFLRVFLRENFRKDYGFFARHIYNPRFVNLINTPVVFIETYRNKIDEDIHHMFDVQKVKINGRKRVMTDYKNIYFYIKYRVDKLIRILSKNMGKVIAKTRFTMRQHGLITKKNLSLYLEIAKPGDILLTRGNWNASNISIPGFWKHMSMYIGNGKFLKENYKSKITENLDDKLEYIIEATGEGVKVVEINQLAFHNDYLGVSRTKFEEEKILRTIKNSLTNVGKGYDHLFDFHSDKSLVCSELIIKSYAKEFDGDSGIIINLETIGISLTYPPNNFVNKLFKEGKTETGNIFPVFFIDSIEKTQKNFVSTTEEFLKSRKRPKLSLFLK